ncbi:hypothetical protein [Nannocystis pusilla]|uniref:SbsA Ig-like domain-containing protein n=1 Tax=Nannocystis pusilla TaxID=889268 RepID=A0ABS7TQH7_9BACT|nr:hypothetical protein [Nannocystis pusilla]MBZ5710478.1 hypothetical protein [Nannocystis pusilla]
MGLERRILVIALAVGLALTGAELAQACSCARDKIGPGRLYLGTGDTLPANAPGIPWSGTPNMTRDQVRVTRKIGGRQVVVAHDLTPDGDIVLIVPRTRLKPGDVYTVTVREDRWRAMKELRPALERQFGDAIPPAELTTTVTVTAKTFVLADTTLRITEHVEGPVHSQWAVSGACSSPVVADALAFSVDLPPEVEPFRDYLLYATFVDDLAWEHAANKCGSHEPGRTWTEHPGTDRIFSECPAEPDAEHGLGRGLVPGRHRVQVRIRAPGGRHVATASGEFELGCGRRSDPPAQRPSPPAPEPDAAPTAPPRSEPPPLERSGCAVAGDAAPTTLAVWGPPVIFALGRRLARER